MNDYIYLGIIAFIGSVVVVCGVLELLMERHLSKDVGELDWPEFTPSLDPASYPFTSQEVEEVERRCQNIGGDDYADRFLRACAAGGCHPCGVLATLEDVLRVRGQLS